MEQKRLSRRTFLRLSSLAAVGVTIAACAPAAAPAEEAPKEEAPQAEAPAANKKWAFWPEWGGKDADALKVQVDKFNAENGLECDYLPIRDHARMVASISAGEPPDLLMTWDSNAVGTWGFEEALIDLMPFITAAKMDLNNFFKIGLDSGNLMGIRQIGLPLTNYLTSVLYFNKTAFEAAGLDPETPPETWEDTWTFSEKLTEVDGSAIKKLGFMVNMGQDGHPTLMAYANGGSIWSDDFRKVTPDSEANIAGLTWQQQFFKKYTADELDRWGASVETDGTLPTFSLYAGISAMRIDGEWLPNMYEALDPPAPLGFGFLPYPMNKPDVKGTMTANTNPMVIPKAAKNPDAGFKFIEFISRAENTGEMCVPVGNASPTKDGLAKQISLTTSVTYKTMLEEVWAKGNIKPMTINSPVGSEYMDAYGRARDAVLKDGADPATEMAKLREEIQPKLDEALAKLGV